MPDFTKLRFRECLAVFVRHGVEFVVVGGVSALIQGSGIATFDLDVVHRRTEENLQRLELALHELGAVYRLKPEVSPTTRHLSSDGHHLLSTSCGALDLLGTIGHGWDYESLSPHFRLTTLAGVGDVALLDLAKLIEVKEETATDKDDKMLPKLKRLLSERDRST